ncbi:MAG: Hsp20/alpha crystallin family protein [Deltaproteobacteria bacterium]|nr:Hsp20/alpha crystallin family protein [Deltaproteobacteria bacterium]MBW2359891.1 Hsp20/alpha crystallin family protein [Deltaproteobacteria bacterium]
MSSGRRDDPFAELYGEFRDRLQGDRWQPDVDIFETEKKLVVRLELAGVQGAELQVTVDGDALRISGVRLAPEPADVRRLHQMEIATGPFERRLRMPIPFDREGVSAHLADGFLTVTLPKRAPVQREVAIQGEAEEQ